MADSPHHCLAQLNVARMKAPLDSPVMSEFVARLEPIYREADRAPGFVWRFVAAGEGPLISADDQLLLVNMSVWESVDACHAFVYRGAHAGALLDRTMWFERMNTPSSVLWWVPRSVHPRVEQGMARLRYLERHGPTPFAFTFRQTFPPRGVTP